MLRFNKWTNECLETVTNDPKATKLDKYLVQWVRVTRIQEELGLSLSFDDPSNMADLAEPMVQLKVTGFEKALDAWKKAGEHEANGKVYTTPRLRRAELPRNNHVTISPHTNVPPRDRNAR